MTENSAPLESEALALPSAEEFAFTHPLYARLETKDLTLVSKLTGYTSFKFDMFCVRCGKESTFSVSNIHTGVIKNSTILSASSRTFVAHCTRVHEHQYLSYIRYTGAALYKVGQYPSIEDIAGADIRKYRPLLKAGYFAELVRATGLASHGIGIGSFVYLRRIFEKLISDHYAEHVGQHGEIEKFATMRMDEKIDELKGLLPVALVENRAAYAILSKGIHELSEEECKLYFPVVRAAIINILEEDFQEVEKAKAAKAIRDQVAAIAGRIRSSAE